MPDPRIRVESCAGGFDRILLSRPARRNALVPEMVLALNEALGAEDGRRPVLISSADPAAFCAGADLSLSLAEQAATSELLYSCYEQMITRPGPVIAVIEGPAVGGGAQLAAAADLRVAGPGARLRWAGPPGRCLTVGTWIVPELAGQSAGLDIVLSGRWIHAAEALALGLLTHLETEPEMAAERIAEELAARDQATWKRQKLMKADVLLDRLHAERIANGAAFAAFAERGKSGPCEGGPGGPS